MALAWSSDFSAAVATTAAILEQKPMAILSCGCSGAHVRDLRMGDVVLATEVKPLDAVVLERGGKVRRTGVRRSMQDPQVQRVRGCSCHGNYLWLFASSRSAVHLLL